MKRRIAGGALFVAGMVLFAGCDGRVAPPVTGSAAIVGTIGPGAGAGKSAQNAQLSCPDAVVTVNGAPVDIEFDSNCVFLIDNVQPGPSVVMRVELPDLGVAGTIELSNVEEAELIEVVIDTDDDSLTISTVRRATPDPLPTLPDRVRGNNVTIFLPAGMHEGPLTIEGNNFTLVGEFGDDCNAEGWTIIAGDVVIEGNNATFRNIRFDGRVEVRGNNASFINSCFGSELIIFGNNTEIDDIDDDGDDNNDNGDDDDDNDNGDDGDNDNRDDNDNDDNDNGDDNGNENDNDDNDNSNDDNDNDDDDGDDDNDNDDNDNGD